MSLVRVGDVGTAFRATVKDQDESVVDLSAATLLELIFRKPSQEVVTKTASLYTDGSDGKMQYVTVTGDLDLPGLWRVQARVTVGGASWSTSIETFRVHKNL